MAQGHPKGLYVCFGAEMFERLCYYGMRGLLILYLTKALLQGDTRGHRHLRCLHGPGLRRARLGRQAGRHRAGLQARHHLRRRRDGHR